MTALETVTWGTAPVITAHLSYERRRAGADMEYRVQVDIDPVSGASYFGYPIYLDLTVAGVKHLTATLKNAYPSRWSSAISYVSAWYSVSNKVSGTTPLDIRLYSGMGTVRDVTYSYDLPIDPAASTLTADDGTLGTRQRITVTRQNTAFTHTLTYTCGTASGTLCERSTVVNISWTPSVSLASQAPDAESVTVTLTLVTYDGDTEVGTQRCTVQYAIPASVIPTLSLTLSDPSGYEEYYTTYVQSQSRLAVTLNAAGIYGARITAYETVFDGTRYTGASFTTGVLKTSGTLTVTAKVTDSRGRTATAEATVTVSPYHAPQAAIGTVQRCDADGTLNRAGAYLRVQFTAKVTSLDYFNYAAYTLYYRKSGESVWENTYLGAYDDVFSVTDGVGIFPADTGSSYDIDLTVEDEFSSGSALATGPSVFKFMSWLRGGRGIAFGKVAQTQDVLDSAWQIHAREGILLPDGTGGLCTLQPERQDGVEYLTHKRWMGKPVYCQTVNCGTPPAAGTTKSVGIGAGCKIIRYVAFWQSYILPYAPESSTGRVIVRECYGQYLTFLSAMDRSGTLKAYVEYIKS